MSDAEAGSASLSDRFAATLADRYRITRELGTGGMATVYLAEDVRHQRQVAIKVMREELSAELGAKRFLREIRTTANLRHPHVLPMYDSGTAAGMLFYVMPFIEGESLRDRMRREATFPLEDAVRIASEVAEALAYAHERGVIHRDIKPENILLERGHAVVADFGIAKAVTTPDSSALTRTGLAVGTPTYMSPEQALADPALDGRSDVYSLGCVLFEMLTGEAPFADASAQRMIARRLTEPPPILFMSRPNAGVNLSALLQRVLAADPTERPPDAGTFASLLAAATDALGGSVAPARPISGKTPVDSGAAPLDEGFWLAVLPFRYRGTSADLDALAQGLSEEIVTGFSRFTYLRIVARSSTAQFTGDEDVRAAGKALGARYVMGGSLRQAGASLRIAVQLVDAHTGATLWAETYERAFAPDQIFALQDDLVPRIVATVADPNGALPHTMSQAVRSKRSDQLTPYEALLRSFSYAERVTAEEHAEAKAALERAVQVAPGFSDCWAMLSIMLADEYGHGFGAKADILAQALECARRAVDADPSNHRGYQALAWSLYLRKEFPAARKAAERAIALNPMDACTMVYSGQTMAFSGDWERGCELIMRAIPLNPHHPGWYWYAPFLHAYRHADYRSALDLALKMNLPGVSLVDVALAASWAQLGDLAAARIPLGELLARKPEYADVAHEELGKWFDKQTTDALIDGLRKAGMGIADR